MERRDDRAPSPTAAATRLTEPDRTSPMAKTPGRLVSSDLRSMATSAPVNMKPLGSSATPTAQSFASSGDTQ
jgi:hypothetical protein